MKPDIPDLSQLLHYWQKELKLQDWTITIQYNRHYHLDSFGCTTIRSKYKTASIQIVDPLDIPDDLSVPTETEIIVIHELIHIMHEDWLPESKQERDRLEDKHYFENYIDTLAQALYRNRYATR